MVLYADNILQGFITVRKPFSSNPNTDDIVYSTIIQQSGYNISSLYIHNIATGAKPNNNSSVFALVGEDQNNDLYLIVMLIDVTSPVDIRTIWRNLTQPNIATDIVLGIDSESAHIYVVQLSLTLYFDVNSEESREYYNSELWDRRRFIRGEALAVTNDHRLFLLAYRMSGFKIREHRQRYDLCLYTVDLSNVSKPIPLEIVNWPIYFSPKFLSDHREYSTLSIVLDEELDILIAGIPSIDTVVILSIRDKSQGPVIIKEHISLQKGILFGKSVALLDNNTYAVLAYAIPSLTWFTSQIQVYSLYDRNKNQQPSFVFPNNQQPLPKSNTLQIPYRIVKFVPWDSVSSYSS
ncbi:hypothetical protein I4U23_003783 [Adineta vaga]|nr:hypothetical protein I4U23_003783 [Adineta vaga]